MQQVPRRTFITGATAAAVTAVAGCVGDDLGIGDGDDDSPEESYEIWAADQGTNTIYIYAHRGDAEFEEIDQIDTGQADGQVPHMVHFSSDYEYAAIACTAGARTLVYRTEDRELVGNLATGAGSHFAGFSPDDDAIIVDVIGESEIVRIDADLDEEDFSISESISIDEEVDGLSEAEGAPICHSYDNNGRSIHTLGPSYHNAGLVIVDHDDFSIDAAFTGDEVPTNCGTMPHPNDDTFYLTAGLPSDPEADPDDDPEAAEGVGTYYVLDTEDDEIVAEESTGGADAHGFWYTTDGEELWVLNRETNNGVVVDPSSDEVIDDIEAFGPAEDDDPDESDAPDIMWASPDGEFMFVTLRGPVPVSGDPHAATGVTPGFSVLNTETKEIETVVEPNPIAEYSDDDIQAARDDEEDAPSIPDFHGIGVRPIGDVGDAITSPPF